MMVGNRFHLNRQHYVRFGTLIGLFMIVLPVAFLGQVLAATASTSVCGPITSNTVWNSAGSPYVVTCDVDVTSGVTLTVQPGTTVEFDAGTSLIVNGTLVADSCSFTSSAVSPAEGDWGRILFTSSSEDAVFDANGNYLSGSKIEGCVVQWGGGNVNGSVETSLASPFLSQNTIMNSATSGIYAQGRSTNVPIVISANGVSNNIGNRSDDGGAIYVVAGNVFSNTVTSNGGVQRPQNGGGIWASSSMIEDNVVNANLANGLGGGIYAAGSTVSGNIVTGNDGGIGGGIYVSGSTASNNSVSGNSASWGGGIGAVGVSTLTGNTVSGNSADLSNGGGIHIEGGTVSGNMISGNSADDKGGGIYAENATVTANDVSGNSATDGGGIFGQDTNATDNNVENNNASISGGGIYALHDSTVTGNTVTNNNAASGGGIFGESAPPFNGVTLTGNTVQNNGATFGGGIYAIESAVNGNMITANDAQSDGGGIYANGGNLTGNSLTSNAVPSWGHGSGAYLSGQVEFSSNTVTENIASGGTAGGISIDGQPNAHLNNLHDNQPYDAELVSATEVDIVDNYWGASVCSEIPGQIYDGDDAPGRGLLIYAPSLYLPVPLEQMSAIEGLSLSQDSDTSVTLSWMPGPAIPNVGCRPPGSTEPDMGYRVYYDSGGACTLDGQGILQGSSPIDVGQNTQITLTGLSMCDHYYFVVASYDYLGRESLFSSPAVRPPQCPRISLPAVITNG